MTSQNKNIQTHKKVLYIGGFELPDKNAAAHRVMSNAKIIREIGGNVVFVGIGKELPWGTPVLETRKIVQGFVSYAIPYPKEKEQWIRHLTCIEDYIKIIKCEKNISAVIFYNFPAISMRNLKRFCKRNNIKCVADITEWYSASGKGLAYYVLKGMDTWLRMHIYHKQMDGLIVISKFLNNYYQSQKNIVLIPPLIDKKENKWMNLSTKKINGPINLVYAGSPELKDRVDLLISALQIVKRSYHLDIIGLTMAQYLERCPADRSFLENNKNIAFLGRLPHQEVLKYVSSSDYSCFFRDDDRMSKAGFSTKFVEAISCGTPVLTNKTSNLEDYCSNDMNAILIEGISSGEIADAIEKLEKGMDTVQTQFDYRTYIERMQYFFLNL